MRPSRRCFIAAAPDTNVRSALADWINALALTGLPGRAVPTANLHLTWAFIGHVDGEQAAAIAAACDELRPPRVEWTLDRLLHFPRAQVLAAGGAPCEPLADTATQVRAALDRLQIDYDRKPFRPHVTLFRKATQPPPASAPTATIRWTFADVALYQSTSEAGGVTYQRLSSEITKSWRLTG